MVPTTGSLLIVFLPTNLHAIITDKFIFQFGLGKFNKDKSQNQQTEIFIIINNTNPDVDFIISIFIKTLYRSISDTRGYFSKNE